MKEELVKAAQKGDSEAFYQLISEDIQKLYKIAYYYFKNQTDALEAIQEVTCRAYVKLQRLREPQFFSTWLTRIMINYCIDEQKRKKKLIHMEEVNHENSSSNEWDIDTIFIEEALDALDPKYKKVIILKYFQDMSTQEISKALQCPEGTVKTWVHRALAQLRILLNKEGDFDVRKGRTGTVKVER